MESPDTRPSTLMIMLDALLDTRLAILFGISEGVSEKAIQNGYHRRLIDDFEGADFNTFAELYKNRTKAVMANAIATPMTNLIKEFVEKTHRTRLTTPFGGIPKVIVNTYPYVLTGDETKVIINAVYTLTNGHCDIQVVHMDCEEMTPRFVRDNLMYLIMYQYLDWLEVHAVNGKWKKITCPDVMLMAPAIYFKPIEGDLSKAHEVFPEVEKSTKPFIDLQLMPIADFSVTVLPKVEDSEQP